MFESFFHHLREHDAALAILTTLVLVLMLGTGAQIFADRLRIPATGPLLLTGLLFGQAGLGLVAPEILGESLRVIVKAAVAVVVFEGGLLLDIRELRHASRAVLGLISVGLLITTAFAGLLARFLLGWSWELSFLFGAIVSVTGPTVITPILQRVRVNRRVKFTLESESVIADPLGVILAALIFTAIISPYGVSGALPKALLTLLAGGLVGLSAAFIVWLLSDRFRLLPAKFSRIGILGAALVAYTVAELFAHEAGVMAAAVSGIAIGSLDIPHKEEIEEFKGDLASLAISAVFILLAASLKIDDLTALGWRGLLIVFLLMAVVRPVRVFLSTFRSELKTNEKWFISFLGPRGIVAASVATFFALELTDSGLADGRMLVSLVFAVILASVLIEGNAAGWLARIFKVMPQHVIIVGADEAGRILAERMVYAGETVSLIDTNENECSLAKDLRGVNTFCADATQPAVLLRAGAKVAKCLIAATASDKVNLLVCQTARAAFGDIRLVARVNDTSNMSAFEATGIEVMSPTHAAAAILENLVLRPSLFKLISGEKEEEHVTEIKIKSNRIVGGTIASLNLQNCLVVAIRRGEHLIAPKGSTTIESGDVLTLLGDEASLEAAQDKLA